MPEDFRPTGHLQIKGPATARRWYAVWRDVDGRHQRVLGSAHVKDSGRRTPRGAVIWRAGDGPTPSSDWMTRGMRPRPSTSCWRRRREGRGRRRRLRRP